MQQKETLKKSYDELVKKIVANSKDAHFAESLLKELKSVSGQLLHEPTLLHLPLKEVAEEFSGETFNMYEMRNGTTVYHVKGGLDIVARPNLYSLNGTIQSFIKESKRYESMPEEEKEAFDTEIQASTYVLNIPMFAFSDIDFMFDTASSVVRFLKKSFEEEMDKPLQEETPEEDRQFEEANVALEEIKKSIGETENAGQSNS